jgi:hypothetical protein
MVGSHSWAISVMYEVEKCVCDACFAPSCMNHWVCSGKPVVIRWGTKLLCIILRQCSLLFLVCWRENACHSTHVVSTWCMFNITSLWMLHPQKLQKPSSHLNVKNFFKLSIGYHFVCHPIDGYPSRLLLPAVCVKNFITPKPIHLSQTHFYNFWFSVALNLVLEVCYLSAVSCLSRL